MVRLHLYFTSLKADKDAEKNAQLLAKEALVYVETAVQEDNPGVPPSWELHREKRAGGVCYRLFVVG